MNPDFPKALHWLFWPCLLFTILAFAFPEWFPSRESMKGMDSGQPGYAMRLTFQLALGASAALAVTGFGVWLVRVFEEKVAHPTQSILQDMLSLWRTMLSELPKEFGEFREELILLNMIALPFSDKTGCDKIRAMIIPTLHPDFPDELRRYRMVSAQAEAANEDEDDEEEWIMWYAMLADGASAGWSEHCERLERPKDKRITWMRKMDMDELHRCLSAAGPIRAIRLTRKGRRYSEERGTYVSETFIRDQPPDIEGLWQP